MIDEPMLAETATRTWIGRPDDVRGYLLFQDFKVGIAGIIFPVIAAVSGLLPVAVILAPFWLLCLWLGTYFVRQALCRIVITPDAVVVRNTYRQYRIEWAGVARVGVRTCRISITGRDGRTIRCVAGELPDLELLREITESHRGATTGVAWASGRARYTMRERLRILAWPLVNCAVTALALVVV